MPGPRVREDRPQPKDYGAQAFSLHSIREIQRAGTAILLVEQDAFTALATASRVYVMEHGRIAREGTSTDLSRDDYIRQVYLGV